MGNWWQKTLLWLKPKATERDVVELKFEYQNPDEALKDIKRGVDKREGMQ